MKLASKFQVHPGWRVWLKDMAVDAANLLRVANLPKDLLSRDDAYMNKEEYFRFFSALDEIAGELDVALLMADVFAVESFNPPLFASLCSPNLNVALERIQRFKPLIAPMRMELDITDECTIARICPESAGDLLPRSMVMIELVFFTQLVRTATRKHIEPISVKSPILPANPARYTAYFGTEVEQGEVVELVFRAQDAKASFLTENAGMWQFFEPELQKRLSNLSAGASTAERVKSALLELIPSGLVSVDNVASELAMSKRTLQRKLTAEGENYQSILSDTRRELAQFYLTKSRTSLAEISYLLGFQETTSFYRAFASWTGQSPEVYRESKRE